MANTLTNAIPLVVARVGRALKPYTPALEKWNTDFSPGPEWRGNEIKLPLPDETMTARKVMPGRTPNAANDDIEVAGPRLTFSEDDFIEVPFTLTDYQRTQIVPGFFDAQIDSAVQQLMIEIEQRLLDDVIPMARFAVSAVDAIDSGNVNLAAATRTPLFAPTDAANRKLPLQPITRSAEHLTRSRAPRAMRAWVMDESTFYGVQALPEFNRVDYTGQRQVEAMGELGQKLGFMFAVSNGCTPPESVGAGTKEVNLVAGYPVGHDGDIAVDGAGTLAAGEVVSFGPTGRHSYVVDEAVGAGAGTLRLRSRLREAIANNADVNHVNAGRNMGLACHRDFAALGTKQLPAVPGESMNVRVGPVWVRVVAERQSDQYQWKVQCCPAITAYRPALGVQIVQ